jgi:photosystem II stability/assembly factor-like uncharacterized protein
LNKLIFIITLVTFNFSFGQQWKTEGPFYGKSDTMSYMHSMGLVSEIFPNKKDTNQILMATNSSGIWKTINRGINWICVTQNQQLIPGMGVASIVTNPNNQNELFAAAGNYAYGFDTYGGAVLRSKNWGDSWELIQSFDSVFNGKSVIKVAYVNSKLFVIGAREVFVSEDNATSWNSIFRLEEEEEYITSRAQYLVDFEITPNGNLFVSSSHLWGARGNAWMSEDEGVTWQNLEDKIKVESIKSKTIRCVKLTISETGKLVAGFNDGNIIHLYQTNNQGQTFYKKGKVGLNWETGDAKASKFEMEFSITNPEKIYMGFIEFFEWDSIFGLKMLSPTENISATEHDDVRAMKVLKIGEKERVLMGNDGGISYYYPEKKEFESLNGYDLSTLQIYNLAISQFDSNYTMLVGTQDNGTFKYEKGEWNFFSGGDGGGNLLDDNAYLQVSFMNSLIAVYQGKIKKYYSPNTRYSSWFLDSPVELSHKDSVILFGSGKKGNSRGATLFFQNIKEGPRTEGIEIPDMVQIGEIAISAQNPDKVWIAEGEHIDKNDNTPKWIKTVDRGKTFIDLTDAIVYPDPTFDIPNRKKDTLTLREMLSYRTITDIEIDPHDDAIIYISLSGVFKPESWTKSWEYYRVLKSEDAGESWCDYSYGLPETPIHCLLRDEQNKDVLFCGGDEGVYQKIYNGEEWKKLDNGFPKNTTVSDLKINYCQNKLYASTYGRGVLSTSLADEDRRIYRYGVNNWFIKKNTTIDSYQFNKSYTITVYSGKTLTITADVLLAPNTEIFLKPKSKLIIDGGSIGSACDSKWKGSINIEEKRFLWFFKRKKGEVILKNGGKINN